MTSFPAPIAGDTDPGAPPPRNSLAGSAIFLAEQDSLRRAMPIQRLIGSGMSFADASVLHAAAEAGVSWDDCGEWLGRRNLRLAISSGSAVSSRMWHRFASACFRAAQSAIPVDTDRKRALFRAMVESFAAASKLDDPVTEKQTIEWRGKMLHAWLLRPPSVATADTPCVIIMGGFDGWREEYYPAARALVDRGVAALLIDGPGQGETRLFEHLFLDADFPDAFAATATHLRETCRLGPKIGIWGNSLGGHLAAATAARHPDLIDALCVNGGTIRPLELPERHERFFAKVEALVGTTDRTTVLNIMHQLDLTDDARSIRCPMIQLHSVPDQVFLLENARQIYDRAASTDKTLLVWDDGDHCIYNHSDEKHAIVADWFATHLA